MSAQSELLAEILAADLPWKRKATTPPPFRPRGRSIFKALWQHARWIRETSSSPSSAATRMALRAPGLQRLLIPCYPVGGDPAQAWKSWEVEIGRRLGCRVPGTWRTKRGRKKKRRALFLLAVWSR